MGNISVIQDVDVAAEHGTIKSLGNNRPDVNKEIISFRVMQSNRPERSNQETGGDRESLWPNRSQRGEIEPRTGEIGSSWVDRAGEKGTRREVGVKKERAKEGGRESGVAVRGGREGQREKSAGGGNWPGEEGSDSWKCFSFSKCFFVFPLVLFARRYFFIDLHVLIKPKYVVFH